MTENAAPEGPFRVDSAGGMTIEWDVPIVADDGNVLRADVFRPAAPGSYPVILTYGPYGKGKRLTAHVADGPVLQAGPRLDPPEPSRPGRRRPLDLGCHRRLRGHDQMSMFPGKAAYAARD
jgi:hypothetical protein